MPAQRAPGASPVGRRIRIRSRIRLPPRPEPKLIQPVQHAAATVGAVFGLVGLLGFLPGLTVHMGDITVAGHHTTTLLFGVFEVSVVHNVIHLAYAVAGLALATSRRAARWFLAVGGGVYLLLAVAGLTPAAGLVPVNTADNWLHLAVGVIMLGLAMLPNKKRKVGSSLSRR